MPGADERLGHEAGATATYDWQGRELIDKDDDRVGVVAALYAHGETQVPAWATVKTGLFGMKETFVPVQGAQPSGERVRVPFAKDRIQDAPRIDPDGELAPDEEAALYSHYRIDRPDLAADEGMTRSEEEMRVGTARRERGRARLRKYVVTEEVRQRVPVEREEARIEREPITEANVDAAMSGAEISAAEHEVALHEEVPVVEKRAVPKERVRLDKETRTDEEEISEQIRKEEIEAEGKLDR